LVAGWYDVAPGPIGHRAPEVDDLAELLGRPMPQSIHEWSNWHRHLGDKVFELVMRDDFALAWRPELSAVTLLIQGEQDYYWGVREDQLDVPDSPVDGWLIDHDASDEDNSIWLHRGLEHPSIAGFAFLHALAFIRGAGRVGGIAAPGTELAELEHLLATACSTRTSLGTHVVYEGVDVIARVSTGSGRHGHYFDVTVGSAAALDLPAAVRRIAEAASSVSGVFLSREDRDQFELPGWNVTSSNRQRRPLADD
jgi:hypothetical protein